MHTWTRLVPAVLLALPLAPSLLRADAETNTAKIEKLEKEIAQLRRDVAKLQIDTLNNSAIGNQTLVELRAMREILDRLARQQETTSQRISGYSPAGSVPNGPNGAVPTTGTITLQNDYNAHATVRINGQSFSVAPHQTQTVGGVPIGSFRYSVDVDGFVTTEPGRTDTLRPTGYTIRIFPIR